MTYARTVRTTSSGDPVGSIMSWPVATVDSSATLTDVAEALAGDEIGAVLVLDHGALVGLVSERDIVTHVASGADTEHLTAGEVMSTDLVTVRPETTIAEAAASMCDSQVRHLPVLSEGLLAGMLSARDLLEVLRHDVVIH